MAKNVRLSGPTLKVLRFFMGDVSRPRSGAEIHQATRIGSGTLYPLLVRLEEAGWFLSEWEQIEPSQEGRPRRRYYTITGAGQRAAREALAPLQWEGALAWQS
ncbi:helix-turn-helix transcriptional regulator [Bradyrhizobium sp. INPA03-11B]|uniref:PadR family transcriptional regulator n=1 Tax=Bradyrhizobium sp. INPA03-11B TaxID=418598 RepID=UPI00338F8093